MTSSSPNAPCFHVRVTKIHQHPRLLIDEQEHLKHHNGTTMKIFVLSLLLISDVTNAFVQTTHKSFVTKTSLFGWGPEPIWDVATVTEVSSADSSGNSVCLSLDIDADKVQSYTVPGQYCQVKTAGDENAKPAFLAIASAPNNSNKWEFLIKKTENNEWLTGVNVGDKLDVSQILGNGFQMKENLDGFKYDFPTQRVLLFAAGSGIAPIRAGKLITF